MSRHRYETTIHANEAAYTELGITLVERGRRGITLTKAGKEILPHARDVLARLDLIRHISTDTEGAVRGKLRFGILYPFSAKFLADSLMDFRRQYPEVELISMDDAGSNIRHWVNDGLVDVCIVQHPTPGIESRLLLQDRLCAIVSKRHDLAAEASVSLESLFDEPFIVPRLCFELVSEAVRRKSGAAGRSQVRHIINDTQTAVQMAGAGIGIALLPETVAQEMAGRAEELIMLPLSTPLSFAYGLGVRSWDTALPATKHFVEFTVKWLEGRQNRDRNNP